MTPDELSRLERIHNRACDLIAGAAAAVLVLCMIAIVWWFALAVTP